MRHEWNSCPSRASALRGAEAPLFHGIIRAVILGLSQHPRRLRGVESHFSQRTREMGHPSARCYLLLADGCVRSTRAGADGARVEVIPFPKSPALRGCLSRNGNLVGHFCIIGTFPSFRWHVRLDLASGELRGCWLPLFYWGMGRTAGPSTVPSLSLRLARDDKGLFGAGLFGFIKERYAEKSVGGDEDHQELQEARGVGGVGVCGAGYGAGAVFGAP